MKIGLMCASLCLASALVKAQHPQVSLQFEKTAIQLGDSLHFDVWCNSNEALEIFVISGDSLLFYENAQISYGEMKFHLATSDFPLGNYFILVTGNNIHIEKQFLLWKDE